MIIITWKWMGGAGTRTGTDIDSEIIMSLDYELVT